MRPIYILMALLWILSSVPPLLAQKIDFSGTYTLESYDGDLAFPKRQKWTLEVVQTETRLTVKRIHNKKLISETFPLDGSEIPYTSPSGPRGKCSGQIKESRIIIDTYTAMEPLVLNPPDLEHKRQIWKLSSDLKRLTIQNDVELAYVPNARSFSGFLYTEVFSRN